jgi:hypothetical protein
VFAATPSALRRAGIVAVAAALLATLGDLVLLWVSYAGSGAHGVRPPPAGVLLPATWLGAVAILVYAVGYWQAACGLVDAGERLARAVFLGGAAMAGVGGVIHGMTGLTVHYEMLRGGDASPARMVAAQLPLWLVGLLCGGIAGTSFAAAVIRGPTAYPRWMAAANPLVLPLLIAGVAALGGPRVRAFVVPAAPNIAHVLFFLLTTITLRDVAARTADPVRAAAVSERGSGRARSA